MRSIRFWASLALAGMAASSRTSAGDGPAPAPAKPAFRFFDRPIDYWNTGRGPVEDGGKKPAPTGDWGHSVKLENGEMAWRDLPAPLVALLEDPTPEKVQTYFEWRVARTKKILRAAELLKEYRERTTKKAAESPEREGTEGSPPLPLPGIPLTASRDSAPFTVSYFHRKGCPPCDRQDEVLAEWLGVHPEGTLEVVEFGMKPELWRELRIKGTPSLLIRDTSTGRSTLLEGFTDRDRLEKAIAGCRRPGEPQSSTFRRSP